MRVAFSGSRTRNAITGLLVVAVTVGILPATAWAAPTPAPSDSATAAALPTGEATPSASATASTEPTKSASAQPAQSASAQPTTSSSAEPSDSPSATPSTSQTSSPRVRAGAAAPNAVPPVTNTTTVITVRTGGNRTGITGVTVIQGVVLGLYATATSTTPLQTCTSDAGGDCNFIVTDTGPNGGNRNDQYYVKGISAPTGWRLNTELRTGNADGSGSEATAYQFQTPALIGGQIISSLNTQNFMLRSGNTTRNASGGIWTLSRVNPTLPTSCGLDVALIMDFSGSVAQSGDEANLKAAADSLVTGLQGTPSRMSLFSFSTVSPAIQATPNYPSLTSVATVAQGNAFRARYAGWSATGGTNWDRGLAAAANAADTPDIAVIITDGNPSYYNDPAEGPGSYTRFREVENGIISANALRAQGTRVITLGVGTGVTSVETRLNLAGISGPVRYTGNNSATADYYQGSYADAAQALRNLALGNCASTISVTKQIVPSGNTGENISGATPAGAGWVFNGSTSTPGIGGLPATQTTIADGTGTVNFPLTFPGGTTTAAVTLAETQQSGYTLVTQGGNNAVCTNLLTGAAVTVTNSGATGFSVNAPSTAAVSCTIYNRAPQPPASIVVDKRWTINGTSFVNGNQPDSFQAQLFLTGPGGAAASAQGWGDTRSGYSVNNTATISETVTLPPLCTRTSSTVVRNGTTTPVNSLPYTATLSQPTNAFTVTNVVTCESRLTLTKEVQGGTAAPTAWTLEAVAPQGALPGPIGATGSAGATNVLVTPGVTYQLRESGGDPAYRQIDNRTNLESNPLSTGSMSCIEIDANGNQLPGFADGINGGVQVPIGERVRCTATNQTASLRLVKTVINDNGGAAVPSDWTLQAAPTGTFPAGLPTISRPGAPLAGAQFVNVRPGVTYNLSELGPAGYDNTSLECTTNNGGTFSVTSVTLSPLDQTTCVWVNNDRPAQLTLRKVVNNGTTGATAVPSDWTLRAAGAVTLTGPGNSAAVTNQTVPAGTYSLAESGGPAGYTASTWSCTGGALTGTSVTVANGANVTCTITNTAVQPRLTLVKVVDNGTTGATTTATAWTLTAAGPSTITGATGSGTVSNAPVPVGTFNLSEAGPAGYTASAWVCTGAASSTATSVTLGLSNSATCTITNTAIAPRLTLVKRVVNQAGGTAVPANWTLTGAGPVTITGTSGSAAVTAANVRVGSYALSESAGPAGYTASGWSCTGGALAGSTVTLALGADATCTITNTDQPARLTLVKVVDNGATGATAVPADWTLSASGPATVTGPGNSASVTNQSVPAGSYTLLESGGPAGYTASSWTCTGGALVAGAVLVPNGGNVTCTITNTAIVPTLTLVKQVVNQAGGTAVPTDWTLSADGPVSITGTTGADEVTNAPVRVGDYTLSEAGGPDGYSASAWSCVGATLNGSRVTVPVGSNATCTIVNTDRPARLTLVKVVDNGTTQATSAPADWTLTASGPATVTGPGNTPAVTGQTVPAGTYNLSESGGPDGYTASSWSCTGATASGSTVILPNAGDVSCTITNTAVAPTLTLVKVVDNGASGATSVATDWTLTASGPDTVTGPGNSPQVTSQTVPVGTFDLSEDGPDGYTASDWVCTGATGSAATSVTLALADAATCTITNTAIVPTLTLVKQVVNDNGGTAAATDWMLSAAGPVTITGSTGAEAVTSAPVQVGDYTLSETGGPDGYSASAWSCVGATLNGSTVTVPLGSNATCTIVNNDRPAQLTLVKVVDNGTTQATSAPADWTLTASGPAVVTGAGNSEDVTDRTVPAGSYTLSEADGPDGYTPSDWSCTGATASGATVTVPNGGDVTCTITNTAIGPLLTLIKVVDNGDTGATTEATEWTLTADGPSTITGTTGGIPVTEAAVPVGTFGLSEDGPDGYTASDWVCTGATGSTAESVTLELADAATCTITNTAIVPTLTLVKQVQNNYGGTAEATDWTLTASGPVTANGTTGSSAVTEAVVQVGDYLLSETGGPGGYTASAWDCGPATLNGSTLTVPLGADITCTITNTDQPAQLTLVKVVDANGSGSTRQPSDWTLTAAPQNIEGQGPVSGNGDPTSTGGVNAEEVFSGSYQLSESGPAGFEGSLWECTGGVVADDLVTVPSGGAVTCTITNTAVVPRLTLVKQVNDPSGIGTAVPADWTLSAAGPTPISGATGEAAVTDAAVGVGAYTLSESGPANYTASDWTCVDGQGETVSVSGSAVTLAEGDGVTCTIVNTPVTPAWAIMKTSEPVSGSTVQPGDEITYTVTLMRHDGVDPRDVVVNDNVSQVLNNATLVTGPTPSTGTASISGTTLTWNVPVLSNPVETVTYTVRVSADAWGVTLRNAATSPGSSPCVPEDMAGGDGARFANNLPGARVNAAPMADDPLCPTTTVHYTPSWTLEKTSDPASGSTVPVGSTITYTLTVTNTSDMASLTGATVTDDLSGVLRYASLGTVGAGGSVTGTTLTWTVPDLGPGEQATLSYTVRVNSDAYNATLRNVATPGDGGECIVCTTTHETPPPYVPPLPQTGTNASLEGALLGLMLAAGGVGVLVAARRRRRS